MPGAHPWTVRRRVLPPAKPYRAKPYRAVPQPATCGALLTHKDRRPADVFAQTGRSAGVLYGRRKAGCGPRRHAAPHPHTVWRPAVRPRCGLGPPQGGRRTSRRLRRPRYAPPCTTPPCPPTAQIGYQLAACPQKLPDWAQDPAPRQSTAQSAHNAAGRRPRGPEHAKSAGQRIAASGAVDQAVTRGLSPLYSRT